MRRKVKNMFIFKKKYSSYMLWLFIPCLLLAAFWTSRILTEKVYRYGLFPWFSSEKEPFSCQQNVFRATKDFSCANGGKIMILKVCLFWYGDRILGEFHWPGYATVPESAAPELWYYGIHQNTLIWWNNSMWSVGRHWPCIYSMFYVLTCSL